MKIIIIQEFYNNIILTMIQIFNILEIILLKNTKEGIQKQVVVRVVVAVVVVVVVEVDQVLVLLAIINKILLMLN